MARPRGMFDPHLLTRMVLRNRIDSALQNLCRCSVQRIDKPRDIASSKLAVFGIGHSIRSAPDRQIRIACELQRALQTFRGNS
ncbi:hypothetical protein C404_24980 [Ralstonia sp. AU12-08]|nr:hypothetical protein C404_24980 [Ralstonia sp. AU12-08]